MVRYGNQHRLFLQQLISRRLVSDNDLQKLYQKCCEAYAVAAPVDGLTDFVYSVNKALEPLFMEIRRGQSEEDGDIYYALVNCTEDEQSKLATEYNPQEVEYIKKILESIIISDEGCVSSIDLINLASDLTKRMTAQAAETIMNQLLSQHWLTESHGQHSLGPRALIELGQYIKKNFKDAVSECIMCQDMVIRGDVCLHCGVKIHRYCASNYYKDTIAGDRKCPSCKEEWTNDVMIPGRKQSGARNSQQATSSRTSRRK